MNITKHRKIFFILSGVMVVASLVFLFAYGLKFNVELTGGSTLEGQYQSTPAISRIESALKEKFSEGFSLKTEGDTGIIFSFKETTEQAHADALSVFNSFQGDYGTFTVTSFEQVGPVVGNELKTQTIWAIIFSLLAIGFYIILTFNFNAGGVPPYIWSLSAIGALFAHTVLITFGAFALFNHFWGTQVGIAFFTAILTLIGYCINDTIVVYDRIRENSRRYTKIDFEGLINKSMGEIIVRSILTPLTVLIVLASFWILGPATLFEFIVSLGIGVVVGTYSSICIAPNLVYEYALHRKRS